ncbi:MULTISPECIES: tRNA pseudouridine(55) synthase TruB [Bacillus]|uniref:tRNA pseudouridine(55) synthase TruB n=1 Tax=Bacillus TaxID=1386 RepID=UPI000705EE44|nr:tRNA pseudouridine(55) synthase TruB [Bacillus altitudinis]ALM29331.1 tRNA pseudouridine synthase B [Bacillus altitudinis]ALM45868.1 tRNA pseudouridine synthase B [Bacillus altitudinis]ANY97349.1 tRNA pseudouridine synthase B [Bacillus altitudinis]WOI42931.1 tRNA pseudouridine(55) synthase TruB [Bacillus altitudinis]
MQNGVLLLHKERGMTSHDCVFKVRKILHTKKVGHTGTLDPEVSGVLPICIGRATKIVEYLTDKSKTYDAEITIGFSTTTEDQTGEVVEEKKVSEPMSEDDIDAALKQFEGTIEQIPPMFSAVKIGGKKLYEYARQGIEIERPSREITIHHIERTTPVTFENGKVSFRFTVLCSKGTYVRTLAVDIGKKLGFPAHMSHLIRIGSGDFTLDECITLDELREISEKGTVEEHLVPIERALNHLPKWEINDTLASKVENGAVLPMPDEFAHFAEEDRVAVFAPSGRCMAIYMKHPTKQNLMKPAKILSQDKQS